MSDGESGLRDGDAKQKRLHSDSGESRPFEWLSGETDKVICVHKVEKANTQKRGSCLCTQLIIPANQAANF